MGLHIGFSYGPATFDWMETVGQRIRRLRKALDMNQTDLAEKLGVDQSTVSDIERGAGFSAELLMKLAGALQSSPALLMNGQDAAVWPFPRIAMEHFLALDSEDRIFVEGRLAEAIADVAVRPTSEDARVFSSVHNPKVSRSPKRKAA